MNYRHAFHAGNFADVMKHIVLARLIEYLKLKPAAFRVIDTSAATPTHREGCFFSAQSSSSSRFRSAC